MKHLVMLRIYIICCIGDAAIRVANIMGQAFELNVAKLREMESHGGAHERRYLRPAEDA